MYVCSMHRGSVFILYVENGQWKKKTMNCLQTSDEAKNCLIDPEWVLLMWTNKESSAGAATAPVKRAYLNVKSLGVFSSLVTVSCCLTKG